MPDAYKSAGQIQLRTASQFNSHPVDRLLQRFWVGRLKLKLSLRRVGQFVGAGKDGRSVGRHQGT